MPNSVAEYGWLTSTGPESCSYITPEILRILKSLNVHRVCDVGSGKGALSGAIQKSGFYISGVEYDKQGVELSQRNYPDINFYNIGVQDDPAEIVSAEGQLFEAVISTEVIEHLFHPISCRALLENC